MSLKVATWFVRTQVNCHFRNTTAVSDKTDKNKNGSKFRNQKEELVPLPLLRCNTGKTYVTMYGPDSAK